MFKRNINIIVKKIMDRKYKDLINANNLETISFYKFRELFKEEEKEWKEKYLHNLINEWYLQNEENESNFKKLKKIILKSKITLNPMEKHNLLLIEERIFSIDRHIKNLEINEKLFLKEKVGAKFLNCQIYYNNQKLKKIMEGNLNISNFRIMISTKKELKSFYWKKIKNKRYENYGFCFNYDKKEFTIRIHDQITLNNTIKNLYKTIIKKWLN